jgi:septal ring factor EnvC (AmiA/AmiB activator)
MEQLKLTEITDLSRDIKRLRDEMEGAKRQLKSLETEATKLSRRADQTDSRLAKIETRLRNGRIA